MQIHINAPDEIDGRNPETHLRAGRFRLSGNINLHGVVEKGRIVTRHPVRWARSKSRHGRIVIQNECIPDQESARAIHTPTETDESTGETSPIRSDPPNDRHRAELGEPSLTGKRPAVMLTAN